MALRCSQNLAAQLNNGKKALYGCLEDRGIDVEVSSSSLLVKHDSRREQLADRRALLLKKWPQQRGLFDQSPGMKKALVTFYGLEGGKPLYDYQETAEMLKMSKSAVSWSINQAVRIILGIEPPSQASIGHKTDRQLYDFWSENNRFTL